MKHGTHELLQFFAYAHLPPHLQEVSKPFCELAQNLLSLGESEFRARAAELIAERETAWQGEPLVNCEEAMAGQKLHEAWKRSKSSEFFEPSTERVRDKVLRLVLEAKDCAVRAVLYQAPGQ